MSRFFASMLPLVLTSAPFAQSAFLANPGFENPLEKGWTVLTGLDKAVYGPEDNPFAFHEIHPTIGAPGRGGSGHALAFPAEGTWRCGVYEHSRGRGASEERGFDRGKAAVFQTVELSEGEYRFGAWLRNADGDCWAGAFSLGVAPNGTAEYAHDDSTGILWTRHDLAMRGDPNGDFWDWGEWRRYSTPVFRVPEKRTVTVWIRFNYVNEHAMNARWEADDAFIETADTPMETMMVPVAGPFHRVYDPSAGEDRPWYINDHTVIRDATGTWHMIGITQAEPMQPWNERFFAHATSPELFRFPWEKHPHIVHYRPEAGETHVWAPHVVKKDDTYYMFYCGGSSDHDTYMINLRTSKDLFNWEWHEENPLFTDIGDARDPMLLYLPDEDIWVMYYTRPSDLKNQWSAVAVRESRDLVHWSEPSLALVTPWKCRFSRITESPFVFPIRDGEETYYYLSATGLGYALTTVWRSKDPRHFDFNGRVTTINSHAPEWIATQDGAPDHVTHCGWGQGGFHIAPVTWEKRPAWRYGRLTVRDDRTLEEEGFEVQVRRYAHDRDPYRVFPLTDGEGSTVLPPGRYSIATRNPQGEISEPKAIEIVEDETLKMAGW